MLCFQFHRAAVFLLFVRFLCLDRSGNEVVIRLYYFMTLVMVAYLKSNSKVGYQTYHVPSVFLHFFVQTPTLSLPRSHIWDHHTHLEKYNF